MEASLTYLCPPSPLPQVLLEWLLDSVFIYIIINFTSWKLKVCTQKAETGWRWTYAHNGFLPFKAIGIKAQACTVPVNLLNYFCSQAVLKLIILMLISVLVCRNMTCSLTCELSETLTKHEQYARKTKKIIKSMEYFVLKVDAENFERYNGHCICSLQNSTTELIVFNTKL